MEYLTKKFLGWNVFFAGFFLKLLSVMNCWSERDFYD
jgi:hypothetical protein